MREKSVMKEFAKFGKEKSKCFKGKLKKCEVSFEKKLTKIQFEKKNMKKIFFKEMKVIKKLHCSEREIERE